MITHGELEFEKKREAEMEFSLGFWVGLCTGQAIILWAAAVRGMAERMKECRECGCDDDEHYDDEDGKGCGFYDFAGYSCDCPGFRR